MAKVSKRASRKRVSKRVSRKKVSKRASKRVSRKKVSKRVSRKRKSKRASKRASRKRKSKRASKRVSRKKKVSKSQSIHLQKFGVLAYYWSLPNKGSTQYAHVEFGQAREEESYTGKPEWVYDAVLLAANEANIKKHLSKIGQLRDVAEINKI